MPTARRPDVDAPQMTWTNVRLLTAPTALVDIKVERGLIASIAPAGAFRHPGALDLDGRFVIPGLWDEHVHFDTHLALSQGISLAGAASAFEAVAVLASTRWPADGFVFAHSFRSATWPAPPAANDLDQLSTDRPIVALSGDLHGVWLNRAAQRFFGRADDRGYLVEHDAFDVEQQVLAQLSDSASALDECASAAAARGVVGIVDYEFRWQHDLWRDRMAAGFDTLRVECGTRASHLDRLIASGLRSGQRITELLSVGSLKVIGDGSLGSRTAWCDQPYADDNTQCGQANLSRDELVELLRAATAHRISAAVHAIGDRAVSVTLDAFEASGARGSIEHAQLVAEPDLPRFRQLGVAASVQPTHLRDDWRLADQVWADRTARMFPLASLLRNGAELRFGSDAPVAPLDPWHSIALAVHRTPDGVPWHPEQAIDLGAAIAASTRTSIEIGQPADLVALACDPGGLGAAELAKMPVDFTLVAGKLTHDAFSAH